MKKRHIPSRLRWVALGTVILVLVALSPTSFTPANAQQPVYNTAFLTDAQLEDYASMTVNDIRGFLISHNSYFQQSITDVDGQIFDPVETIAQAATQYRINPKVLLATLEKESNGVTRTTRPSDTRLAFLMGCVSSNTARQQLTCAAERFRSYHDQLASTGSTPSGWQVGVPKITQDGVSVSPATRAVAGQFTYTPYAGVQWGGNQTSVGGVYLFFYAWNHFNFGSVAPPDSSLGTSTSLVIDVSGSMSDPWMGGIKIESAKSAANQIVNMLEQESRVSGVTHRAGLVSFSTDAYLNLGLSSDYGQMRMAIGQMQPQARTNIGSGIATANQVLRQAHADESKIMILLSDGLTNEGLSPNEIITGPVQEAVNVGTCIYTVGYGDPGNLDEDLLRRIAASSGCGEYYYATSVSELERVYIRIRHESTGEILDEFSGSVAQGETATAGTVQVPPGKSELAVSLHWPGSKLDLRLRDPQGQVVDQNYPGANFITYANLVYAIILQPVPGNWIVEVIGSVVPQAREIYDVTVSSRTAPLTPVPPTPLPTPIPTKAEPSGFPFALLVLLLGGGGVALFVYTSVLRRRRAGALSAFSGPRPSRKANLYFVNGSQAGQAISLGTESISIGRGPANQVQLRDPTVSRLHATIRYAQNRWFLQDQNSKVGTYVNNRQVNATSLNNGDRIRIGSTEFIFRVKAK